MKATIFVFMAVVFYTRTGGTTAEHLIDQPYIIERPVNQVDFDAMMLEYNADRQPSDTVQTDEYLMHRKGSMTQLNERNF
ncbi:hypothetical protein WR25_17446 isoform C [Diploscapter pachys]|uniref:Uncharacterized protein n=1 Tax=Diploscapter pachys TaxID=2018661 RepID=A0A2A2J6Y3_9BILA|nr:hypothetical protein WR25_17446 isoform C [Diploscapter pachys]